MAPERNDVFDQLGIDVTSPAELASAGSLGLTTNAGDLDVLFEPDGAPAYLELRDRAVELEVRGILVPISSREDLIAMKRAAGRRVDLDDIAILTHPAQTAPDLAGVEVKPPPDWGKQVLGRRPERGRGVQRLWDRAAEGIYMFHGEFGAPGRELGPLEQAPDDPHELRVWRRAVERVAEAREELEPKTLPLVAGDLAAALAQLRGSDRGL